jgi:alkaline phosphatase D
MRTFLPRRDFLRLVVVGAAAGALPACSSDDDAPVTAESVFPQGLASGDPKPDSVVLWVRAFPPGGGSHTVSYEVAEDEAFTALVASGQVDVDATTDHTLRLKVTGLSPYTHYYYRFSALGVMTPTGRTKTAPTAGDDVGVRFAFASCQDYNGRYYHAYKALLEEPEVDFVLHLGDYVYETEGDPRFQDPTSARRVTVPDGLPITAGEATYKAARTLVDYRTLYQTYRSDPDLREVHRLFPFIAIWDDHEFANDCWKDHATDFDEAEGDEKSPDRRAAATQAWFEYQPMDVERDAAAAFPDDIRIYRSLRFGSHLEIFLTDQRYYRDDHVIPEGPVQVATGKIEQNTSLGSRNFVLKSGFDPIEAAAAPTMLGAAQKAWLVDGITGSDASWKIWGSETQLSQMLVDLSGVEELPDNFRDVFYFTCDQWDGYRSERAEILGDLAGVDDLVILTGDIHAFYASDIYVDFDDPVEKVAVEYVCAGISSSPIQEIVQKTIDTSETLKSLGLDDVVPQFDTLLQQASPHYQFLASNVSGIALVDLDADELVVTFLVVSDVKSPSYGGVTQRIRFRTPAGSKTIEPL